MVNRGGFILVRAGLDTGSDLSRAVATFGVRLPDKPRPSAMPHQTD
jgi:hypothetical protein